MIIFEIFLHAAAPSVATDVDLAEGDDVGALDRGDVTLLGVSVEPTPFVSPAAGAADTARTEESPAVGLGGGGERVAIVGIGLCGEMEDLPATGDDFADGGPAVVGGCMYSPTRDSADGLLE